MHACTKVVCAKRTDTHRHIYKPTDRHAGTNIQTDIYIHTYTHTHIHTYTHTHTGYYIRVL